MNNAPSTRPHIITHHPSRARLSFPIPTTEEILSQAEITRDEFLRWLDQQLDSPLLQLSHQRGQRSEEEGGEEEEEEGGGGVEKVDGGAQIDEQRGQEASLLLLAHYLQFLSTRPGPFNHNELIHISLTHFHSVILKNLSLDLHSAAFHQTTSDEARRLVIKAYFLARHALSDSDCPRPPVGKLWSADGVPQKKLVGVFGGQGVNETYWQELVNLYSLYPTILLPFLEAADQHLHSLCSSDHAQTSSLYKPHGIQILKWLNQASSRPPTAYLASCPISLPLIGLVQIAHYITLGGAQGLTPNAISSQLKGGVTGHSQGVVVAALIAGKLPSEKDTWAEFNQSALHAISVLFQIGFQGSLAFPQTSLAPKLTGITAENEGIPTPMLAVTGLGLDHLQKAIDSISAHLAVDLPLNHPNDAQVSLFNGPKAFVVTGHPRTLVGLVSALRKSKAEPGLDQSKIPFSKRLPVFSMRFLPIGVPYHSHHLEGCTVRMMSSVEEGGIGEAERVWWEAHKATLSCPVFNTETGTDMRSESKDFLETLADQIFTSPIKWTKACAFPEDTTHIIDFGLGTLSGIGSLVARNTEGKGHRIVFVGLPASGQGNKSMNEVYDSREIVWEQKWSEKYKIRLLKTKDGRLQIDTPFSRLLSKPPLMVAGMTPCTVPADFNAAVMNAGYHIELAGGGHYNAKALRSKISTIRSKLQKPGLGFTLNALYINQKQWAFQFPLWLEMRKEGLPMEGFVVAAGIPSTEKAKEIIDGLREAGIKHVSFKPGSVDGIRQVINIAAANPDFPVICQWTGGRAGGHHSCEDFHQPILATYASIRNQPNLILVVGSGFGSAEDVYPYLTGQWSRERFGVEMMPFDGVLFASRMMVAKEAATSQSVKDLIVQAKGVDDQEWEGTYDRETGGIITVTSELGEPIHKIATRGIKLWKEFDETVFALPREKRAAWLESHKDYVIKRLNADFQKPWFAEKDGQPAELGDMTYQETVHRLVRLLFVKHQSRWIDPTLRNLVGDWLRRIEERLSVVNGPPKVSEIQSYSELDEPFSKLETFFNRYPEASTQILASEDIAYFLALCQRPGQKPVPFIPVLDAQFGIWFKKDSLWQAEDIDAVVDQDPQRVAILQGPVAVRHSTTTEETAEEILRGIEDGVVKRLLTDVYGGDEGSVPEQDYLCRQAAEMKEEERTAMLATARIKYRMETPSADRLLHTYDIDGLLPPPSQWLACLAGSSVSWISALLNSLSFLQGPAYIDNQLQNILKPKHHQRVQVLTDRRGTPVNVKVFGGLPAFASRDHSVAVKA
ncbi:beta subunit of fatty acid synthetase [Puccinia graminis f. sp. tritici]|uniref:Beta subunit of fatty acid synthetase n=1 Tax=Puccinia graminis f. sp. tritici TaxID=56615 RepID=A0A5B0PRN2_PUCGR|nr:beta subunit of fatty acid synthetase [Puccinia graminis f. sp. tritici]